MKEHASKPIKGLHTDYTPKDQPKDTYTFALNAVDETIEGNGTSIVNDESNVECAELPANYQIIGKCYIGNDKTALFLVHKDNTHSEIGILDSYCKYTTVVNDSGQTTKLNFKVQNQIDARYRLRRGCEDVVYFVDGNNDDRLFNFGQPDDFKNSSGQWDIDKFKLDKTPSKPPIFTDIEVKEEGNLKAGSYHIGIALADEDLNSTSVLVVTDSIIIFNDSYSQEFKDVSGSTTEAKDYYKYGNTSKNIEITLDDLDASYKYYRVFLIERNVANGTVSKVSYSDDIPLDQKTFSITGDNTPNISTYAEVLAIKAEITASKSVEIIDNRLVRGNNKGTVKDYCAMQKLASKVRADLALKEVTLNDINVKGNPKRGTIHEENSLGFMPGEIYALGIVYVFPNNVESPTFHIPGRAANDATNKMSTNNAVSGVTYTGHTCTTEPYWGKDNMGNNLVNQPVRHHRFPTRKEANIPLYTENVITNAPTGSFSHTKCVIINQLYNNSYNYDTLYLRITYNNLETGQTGVEFIKSFPNIYKNDNEPVNLTVCLPEVIRDSAINPYNITQVKFVNPSGNDGAFFIDPVKGTGALPHATQTISLPVLNKVVEYKSQIMGLNFSNIELPTGAIGYYITRMERDDANKTILDTGILAPLMSDTKYEAFGGFNPFNNITRSTKRWALFNPEHKFLGKEYDNINSVERIGRYAVNQKRLERNIVQDVQSGTSYNQTVAKRRERDEDGFDLHTLFRYNETAHTTDDTVLSTNVTDVRYLSALANTTMQARNVFNASSDNKIGVLQFDSNVGTYDNIPYVALKKNVAAPYANFKTGAYYKQHTNIQNKATFQLFSGDTYMSSMNLTNSTFYDVRLRNRSSKNGIWRIIAGTLLVAFGVVATVLTLGLGVPVTAAIIGAGLSAAASGINQAIIKKTYQEEYEKGLKNTIKDNQTNAEFGGNPPDDEIQWFVDILPNIWFESTVNINWRTEPNYGPQTFQYSPDFYNRNRINNYILEKLSILDTENQSGRLYQGFANAEVYFLNKDYRSRGRLVPSFALPNEYDCCSKCREEFPHRIYWSEQSFQEELTDNFRTTLANNYRDIEGDTGPIVDMFTIRNNLYIHTAEGLWHLPQNIQERVTGDVVSFVGTGSYFSIPPRKIVDDNTGLSAGNEHKWGRIKTPYGVFFVCENQRVIYQFDGNKLTPISSFGNFSLFKKIVPVQMEEYYRRTKNREYPFKGNHANRYGTGYHLTYDSKKERVIFTKRDLIFRGDINPQVTVIGQNGQPLSKGDINDFEVAYHEGNLIMFSQYSQLIATYTANGFSFEGIVKDELIFHKFNATNNNIDVVRVKGYVIDGAKIQENSWTKSYSLKKREWRSFHSFLPQFYIHTPERFFSFIFGNNNVWQHNRANHYQNYYGVRKPFIVEFISNSNPMETRIYNRVLLITEAENFITTADTHVDERFITFNKAILYNSRQCSGLVNLVAKDTQNPLANYTPQQIDDSIPTVEIDKNEKNWTFNEFYDIRTNYNAPIWKDRPQDLQSEYFIDKVLNTASMSINKDWFQVEDFRDKYLCIRLIFDTFDNIKLSLDYTSINEQKSFR
jgi:hypothetical protein